MSASVADSQGGQNVQIQPNGTVTTDEWTTLKSADNEGNTAYQTVAVPATPATATGDSADAEYEDDNKDVADPDEDDDDDGTEEEDEDEDEESGSRSSRREAIEDDQDSEQKPYLPRLKTSIIQMNQPDLHPLPPPPSQLLASTDCPINDFDIQAKLAAARKLYDAYVKMYQRHQLELSRKAKKMLNEQERAQFSTMEKVNQRKKVVDMLKSSRPSYQVSSLNLSDPSSYRPFPPFQLPDGVKLPPSPPPQPPSSGSS
ncbi:hypothetical protein EV182_004245 [Spiromyces aspiralis]|uniref:Uncharacterized protein n=1 Tax=Spiromyces aspiralis TaxID=68401 RepID=A0ACC1HC96_9FUNG|nr:hypothetical protein EV182_004245 [Spiromyces aspiralis]